MTKNIKGNFPKLEFDTRADLKMVSGSFQDESAETLGYSAVGDGGDVEFTWSQGSPPATFSDDGGATALPDGGDGSSAWIARDVPLQYAKKWGLIGDGVTDDTTQNQRMIDFAAANDQATVLYEAGGDFAVTSLTNSTGLTLLGENCVFTGISDPIITQGQFIIYNANNNYPIGDDVKGSDGVHYTCLIANGPSSSVVDPVGDSTGTWVFPNSLGRTGEVVSLSYEPTPTQKAQHRLINVDGSSVLDSDFPELLAALGGKIYGNVDGTHFNLPDLRGHFPRFWDNGAGVDPDAASRADRGDGTTGDEVGTGQGAQNAEHAHSLAGVGSGVTAGSGYLQLILTGSVNPNYVFNQGGSEARPTNIYVWGGIFY